MVSLPDILFEEQYKDFWEWDGWKPKAKDNAPQKVKEAIEEWVNEAEPDSDEDSDEVVYM